MQWQHRCGQDTQKRAQQQRGTRMEEWRHQLLAQDKSLIQGTTLPQLLQTSQEHKLAWLAQITLAPLAYATVQDGDTPTRADNTNETTHPPWKLQRGYNLHCFHASSILTIITMQQEQTVRFVHNITHHMAAGSGRQTAQHHMATTPTSPFSLRTIALRTGGSGCKPVTLTPQSAIRHRSREIVSLAMLTTCPHSPHSYIFYCLACPHHLFLKIWYNRGGPKSA
jgi:hypothetical protein